MNHSSRIEESKESEQELKMRLITTQTGRLRMDVCSEYYVLENKEQRSSQMARFPGRRTAQRESTHEGPATKIKEFQSINNIKGYDEGR